MEGKKENGHEEFENLLGEMPNAASGIPQKEKVDAPNTPNREETLRCLQGKEGDSTPLRDWDHLSNMGICSGVVDAWKDNVVDLVTTGCEQGVLSACKGLPNLPDDHYLTATFGNMSLKDVAMRESIACVAAASNNGAPTDHLPQLDQTCGVPSLSNVNSNGWDGNDTLFVDHSGRSAYNSINQKMGVMFPESMLSNSGLHGFPYPLRNSDPHAEVYMPPNGMRHSFVNLSNNGEESYPQMKHRHYYFPQYQNMGDRVYMNHRTDTTCPWSCGSAEHRPPQVPVYPFEKRHEGLYDMMGHGSHHCFTQSPGWRGGGYSFLPQQEETKVCSLSSCDAFKIQASTKAGREGFSENTCIRSPGLNPLEISRLSNANTASFDNFDSNWMPLLPIGCHQTTMSNGGMLLARRTCMASPSDDSCSRSSFGSSSQKFNSLDEVVGHIYSLAKDQNGCRFLQRKFAEGVREDMDKIFVEITDHITELTTDPFGNYLVQKLVEYCNEQQRTHIVEKLTADRDELIRISCDMHGTRSVQKVIEHLNTPEQFSRMASALSHGIVQLMTDSNGNHVVQRCLQHMPKYNEFIFAAALQYFKDLATNRHGCCILQKCLHNGNEAQQWCLLGKIIESSLPLSMDQFGNYVVQYAIEHSDECFKAEIFKRLQGNFGELSQQKSGSHVVERCINNADMNQRALIVQELLCHPQVSNILQDPFGNYVIQTALLGTKGQLHAELVEIVAIHQATLRSSQYGKRVLITAGFKK